VHFQCRTLPDGPRRPVGRREEFDYQTASDVIERQGSGYLIIDGISIRRPYQLLEVSTDIASEGRFIDRREDIEEGRYFASDLCEEELVIPRELGETSERTEARLVWVDLPHDAYRR
jgi:hypothetical protein